MDRCPFFHDLVDHRFGSNAAIVAWRTVSRGLGFVQDHIKAVDLHIFIRASTVIQPTPTVSQGARLHAIHTCAAVIFPLYWR
jgi:hypothetical protein